MPSNAALTLLYTEFIMVESKQLRNCVGNSQWWWGDPLGQGCCREQIGFSSASHLQVSSLFCTGSSSVNHTEIISISWRQLLFLLGTVITLILAVSDMESVLKKYSLLPQLVNKGMTLPLKLLLNSSPLPLLRSSGLCNFSLEFQQEFFNWSHCIHLKTLKTELIQVP